MRNRTTPGRRSTTHALRVGTVLLTFLAGALSTGVAGAATTSTAATAAGETDTMSFGLLGPVGLGAVALGIVGMALGVIRQRRKAAQEAEAERTAAPAGPAPAVREDPNRSLTPYPRTTL